MLTAQDAIRIFVERDVNNRSLLELFSRGPKRPTKKLLLDRTNGMGAKDMAYLVLALLECSPMNGRHEAGATKPAWVSDIPTEPYVRWLLDHLYRNRRRFFGAMMGEACRVKDNPAIWMFMLGADYESERPKKR